MIPSSEKTEPTLLKCLGQKVRRTRNTQNLTRRGLAKVSGVSERHLAQLELGRGNISIALLAKISAALDVPLGRFLDDDNQESSEQTLIIELTQNLAREQQKQALEILCQRFKLPLDRKKHIALIGIRGSGKTTLGKWLGHHLKQAYVHLSSEIEALAGMSMMEIFSLSGESGFKRLAETAVQNALSKKGPCVLDVSGGIVEEDKLLTLLMGHCFVIWLKAEPQLYIDRVTAQGDLRPRLDREDALSDLKRILERRETYYSKAHVTIDTTTKDIESTQRALLEALPEHFLHTGERTIRSSS